MTSESERPNASIVEDELPELPRRLVGEAAAPAALLTPPAREFLARSALPAFLAVQRWCGATGKRLCARIVDGLVRVAKDGDPSVVLFVTVEAEHSDPETYVVPLVLAESVEGVPRRFQLARLADGRVLIDAFATGSNARAFYESLVRGEFSSGSVSSAFATRRVGDLSASGDRAASPRVLESEQSNSAAIVGGRFFKLFRRWNAGSHPEVEMLEELERRGFSAAPRIGEVIERREAAGSGSPSQRRARNTVEASGVVAVTLEALPASEDLWGVFLSEASAYLGRRAHSADAELGPLAELAEQLGVATAEMHRALFRAEAPEFAPEAITRADLAADAERIAGEVLESLDRLRERFDDLPSPVRQDVLEALSREDEIADAVGDLEGAWQPAQRFRVHGDFHLGQVLVSSARERLWIIDFEGEPSRSLAERRGKAFPLRDVAGMVRSFGYAARVRGDRPISGGWGDRSREGRWMRGWERGVASTFVDAYWRNAKAAGFLPDKRDVFDRWLRVLSIEKAGYELRYELEHRPAWVGVPLAGLLDLVAGARCPWQVDD